LKEPLIPREKIEQNIREIIKKIKGLEIDENKNT
jgi:hypothetical protein